MCRPCSSMRSWSPRPLAPLPPSRQPYWYTVMLSYRWRQPGRLSSIAAVMPATPPPRIATRGSRSPNVRLPEDRSQRHVEVEVEPERHARRGRRGDSELAGDRLSVEQVDRDLVVLRQQTAAPERLDGHVDVDQRLVARRPGHMRVAELLEEQHRRVLLEEVEEEQQVRDDVLE